MILEWHVSCCDPRNSPIEYGAKVAVKLTKFEFAAAAGICPLLDKFRYFTEQSKCVTPVQYIVRRQKMLINILDLRLML